MSLTLQDLFAPIDAGSMAGPRANASSANTAGDPFAALFDGSAAAAKPAATPTNDSAPKSAAPRRADASADHAHTDRSRPYHARSDRARSDDTGKPTSTAANDSSVDRSSSSSSSDQTEADASTGSNATSGSASSPASATQAQKAGHRKDGAHGAIASQDGDNDASGDAGVNGGGVVNLFQVMLLAAQPTDATPTDAAATPPQDSASPTTAAGAAASVAVPTAPLAAPDATAPTVRTAASDIAAVLGDDVSKAQPNAPAAATVPATTSATAPIPAQATAAALPQAATAAPAAPGDIAIVNASANVVVAAQAQAAPATTPTRTTDGRPSRNDATAIAQATATSPASATMQTSFDPRPAQTDTSATTGHADAQAKNDLAQLPSNTNPPAPNASTLNPTAAPIGLPTADGNTAPIPATDPSATNTTAMPIAGAASVATPQQAQAVYAKATSRSDALPQVTLDQVTMHLAKAADDGLDRLTIHLKPAELGSIEVKLEMSDGGISKATITADRPDTLNLLQNSSHRLERALESAGIKADAGSLSFNLRGDGGSGYTPSFAQQSGASPQPSYASSTHDDSPLPDAASIVGYINSRAASGGVDIRV